VIQSLVSGCPPVPQVFTQAIRPSYRVANRRGTTTISLLPLSIRRRITHCFIYEHRALPSLWHLRRIRSGPGVSCCCCCWRVCGNYNTPKRCSTRPGAVLTHRAISFPTRSSGILHAITETSSTIKVPAASRPISLLCKYYRKTFRPILTSTT